MNSSFITPGPGMSIKEVNTITTVTQIHILINCYKHACCMKNSVDPDQLASSEASCEEAS